MSRILIVDDEPLTRSHLAEALRSGGHDVTEADTGKAATRLVLADHFDAVITDLIMPDGHGFDLIQVCNAAFGHLKIVAMTSKGNPKFDYLSWACDCGAHLAFHKGTPLATILDALAALIGGQDIGRFKSAGDSHAVLWPSELLRQVPKPDRRAPPGEVEWAEDGQ